LKKKRRKKQEGEGRKDEGSRGEEEGCSAPDFNNLIFDIFI
jgi:hypothetical protein